MATESRVKKSKMLRRLAGKFSDLLTHHHTKLHFLYRTKLECAITHFIQHHFHIIYSVCFLFAHERFSSDAVSAGISLVIFYALCFCNFLHVFLVCVQSTEVN